MESEQTNKYRSDITHGFKVAHSNILGYYIMTTYTNHITINTLLTHYTEIYDITLHYSDIHFSI